MEEWINRQLQNLNLAFTPTLKILLENYVSMQYQEDAVYTDESLKRELLYLHENNLILLLFIQEQFDSGDFYLE